MSKTRVHRALFRNPAEKESHVSFGSLHAHIENLGPETPCSEDPAALNPEPTLEAMLPVFPLQQLSSQHVLAGRHSLFKQQVPHGISFDSGFWAVLNLKTLNLTCSCKRKPPFEFPYFCHSCRSPVSCTT